MSRRRILIVASWYPTPENPVGGSFVETQARVLARRYDVAVIAPAAVSRPQWLSPRFRQSAIIDPGPIPVIRPLYAGMIPGRGIGAPQSCSAAVEAAFATLRYEWGTPDLIHAHVVLPGGYSAANLGRNLGRPVVLTEHSSPFAMHLRRPWQRRLVRSTLASVDRVIAVSPSLRNQILRVAPDVAIDVVGNVIDTDFFTPDEGSCGAAGSDPRRGPFRFASIALLSDQKGIDILLAAARRLLDAGAPAFEIVIGGDGHRRSALEELAGKLGLSSVVRFVGPLAREAVRGWLRWCDALVLPSRHETFGVVLGEAMACGKPAISTFSGGPEFVITPDTGLLVPIEDPWALVDAMMAIMSGRATFDALAVRSSVEARFGPAAFLAAIEAVYETSLR